MSVLIGLLGAYEQWGLAKIQPPGSVVNLNISCDIYCISATSIDGDWPYIKLIDNTKFKLVVNAQKAFWICLGIADKQQWGYEPAGFVDKEVTYPIAFKLSNIVLVSLCSRSNTYAVAGYDVTLTKFSIYALQNFGRNVSWFAVGVQQWGYVDDASNYSHTVEFSFTIAFAVKPYIIDLIMALKKESGTNFFYALPISVTNTTAKMYYSGYGSGSNNTRGYYWLAIGF